MSRLYTVSADTSEKAKVVGGIFTAMQGVFLAIGIIITGAIFMLLANALPMVLALIVGIIPGGIFIYFFVFKTVEGLDYFTYLKYRRYAKKKTPYLLNDYAYGKDFSGLKEEK